MHLVYPKNSVRGCANGRAGGPLPSGARTQARVENNNRLACQRDMVVAERSLWDRLKQEPRYK